MARTSGIYGYWPDGDFKEIVAPEDGPDPEKTIIARTLPDEEAREVRRLKAAGWRERDIRDLRREREQAQEETHDPVHAVAVERLDDAGLLAVIRTILQKPFTSGTALDHDDLVDLAQSLLTLSGMRVVVM